MEQRMDPIPRAALRLIADRFKLLSNPTRLEVLQLICTEEMSVGRIVEITGYKQANVSKHLGLLDRAGMVRRRTEGNHVYYSVADDSLPRLCEIMKTSMVQQQGELLSRLVRDEEQ
jgi:ArsR family transcriptional regulator